MRNEEDWGLLPPEQEAAFLSQAREFLQSPMGSLLTSAGKGRGST